MIPSLFGQSALNSLIAINQGYPWGRSYPVSGASDTVLESANAYFGNVAAVPFIPTCGDNQSWALSMQRLFSIVQRTLSRTVTFTAADLGRYVWNRMMCQLCLDEFREAARFCVSADPLDMSFPKDALAAKGYGLANVLATIPELRAEWVQLQAQLDSVAPMPVMPIESYWQYLISNVFIDSASGRSNSVIFSPTHVSYWNTSGVMQITGPRWRWPSAQTDALSANAYLAMAGTILSALVGTNVTAVISAALTHVFKGQTNRPQPEISSLMEAPSVVYDEDMLLAITNMSLLSLSGGAAGSSGYPSVAELTVTMGWDPGSGSEPGTPFVQIAGPVAKPIGVQAISPSFYGGNSNLINFNSTKLSGNDVMNAVQFVTTGLLNSNTVNIALANPAITLGFFFPWSASAGAGFSSDIVFVPGRWAYVSEDDWNNQIVVRGALLKSVWDWAPTTIVHGGISTDLDDFTFMDLQQILIIKQAANRGILLADAPVEYVARNGYADNTGSSTGDINKSTGSRGRRRNSK